jgi:microcystin-dependent protein|tara:strand:- start:8827 stop:10911 length:2085 start_codon:yes stop_codon:yes gene_type:complete
MAYTINFSDTTKEPIVVDDLTINEQTDLSFIGKNTAGYAVATGENFLHLLENFANINSPANPVEGQMWYNTASNVLYIFDSTQWVESGGLKKSSNKPAAASSQEGDLWVDAGSKQLYLFANGAWILVGPQFSEGNKTGVVGEAVIDVNDNTYNVVKVFVSNELIAVLSAASESATVPYIRPRTQIPGFEVLYKGITLKNNVASPFKYYGTAERAEALSVAGSTITADKFLRSDISGAIQGNLRVKSNAGVFLGEEGTFNLGVSGANAILTNSVDGADISFRINNAGVQLSPLTITNTGTVSLTGAMTVAGVTSSAAVNVTDTEVSTNAQTGAIRTAGGIGVAGQSYFGNTLDVAGNLTTTNIVTAGQGIHDIGSTTNKFANVYATTANITTINADTITGSNLTIEGNVDSATQLANTTTFRIIGDLTSDDITFNGTANVVSGEFVQEFTAALGPDLISNKQLIAPANITKNTDELLINVVGDSLKKTTVSNILSLVPTMPVGCVVPWAGDWTVVSSRPNGWLLCDGSQVSQTKFNQLFQMLGGANNLYPQLTEASPGNFYLPDLRGRMPMGVDTMNNVEGQGGGTAGRISNNAASVVGRSGGSESKTLGITNLPDHSHNMKDGDEQFYAYRDFNTGDAQITSADSGTTTDGGQLLANSGAVANLDGSDVTTGTPLNVLNPYMSLNFIIYAGEVT